MTTDMSAYGVTELTPEEACATSGGWVWPIVGAIAVFGDSMGLILGRLQAAIVGVVAYAKG
ncbi:hypothetical protein NKH09_23825 [Mesorhizobium sp. M1339]|uniref:hypothetical protein n=1 Tax=Mesorhizobium sp. M1339 TaxID=2957086 RepID=UPI00333DEC4B